MKTKRTKKIIGGAMTIGTVATLGVTTMGGVASAATPIHDTFHQPFSMKQDHRDVKLAEKHHRVDLRVGASGRANVRGLVHSGVSDVTIPVKAKHGRGVKSDTVEASVQPSVMNYPGQQVWTGAVIGEPNSSVIIVRSAKDPDVMATSVLSSMTNTRMSTDVSGRASVDAVMGKKGVDDAAASKIEAGGVRSEAVTTTNIMSTVPTGTVTGTIIDAPITTVKVLNAFSMPAASDFGSWEKSAAMGALDVAMTNDRMQRSGSPIRLQLVDSLPLTADTGDESDEMTDLTRLRTPGDGHYDDAITQRDAFEANFVMLYAKESGCGRAYVNSSYDRPYEFGVVATGCAGNGAYSHEVGHLLGANHDDLTDPNSTPSYSHGYVDVTHGFRDVMSYSTACDSLGKSCIQLPYYSNPQLSYQGWPLGKEGVSDSVRAFRDFATSLSRSSTPSGSRSGVTTSFMPAPGQSGVASTIQPKVWFSGDVSGINSSSVLLKNSTGQVVPSTVSYSSSTHTATIRPNAPLSSGAYTIAVQPSAYGTIIKDAGGRSVGWNVSSFVVGAAPQVVASTPAQGGTTSTTAPWTFRFSTWPSNASSLYADQLIVRDDTTGSMVAWTGYQIDPGTKTMAFTHATLLSGHRYTLVLQGLADASGNTMYPYTVRFTAS